MALFDDIVHALSSRPRSSAAEIAQRLKAIGRGTPTRSEVNSELYRHKSELIVDGDSPPRWSLREQGSGTGGGPLTPRPREGAGRKPAAVRGGVVWEEKAAPAEPVVERPPSAPRTKAELVAAICHEIGIGDLGIGPGSTEPKAVFTEVIAKLSLEIDPAASKPELAEAICRAAGRPWTSAMDSRSSPSGGGDTVTAPGLGQVLQSVRLLKSAAAGGAGSPVSPEVVVGAGTTFGLVDLGRGLGTAHGGGGEGPVHLALKEFVRDHPREAIGEQLTFLAEDLVESTAQSLGAEVSFVTGDRVDLLMQDSEGRFVAIEVEPTIGPSDHIGFHQAAKYWALVAVANGIPLDDVRRLVVATTIDPGLAEHYRSTYGIEPFEVPMSAVTGG